MNDASIWSSGEAMRHAMQPGAGEEPKVPCITTSFWGKRIGQNPLATWTRQNG